MIKKRIAKWMRKNHILESLLNKYDNKKYAEYEIKEIERLLNDSSYYIYTDEKILDKWTYFTKRKECIDIISTASIRDYVSKDTWWNCKILILPCNNIAKKYEILLKYGIKREDIVIGDISSDWQLVGGKKYDTYDINLGYARNDTILGYTIFGEEKKDCLKIVTLGGSTTDPYYANIISWSENLYNRINNIAGMNVTVYCGGVCSYTSSQELMKVIRDVINIKPDILINYSGVNDLPYSAAYHSKKNYPFTLNYQEQIWEKIIRLYKKDIFENKGICDISSISYGLKDDRKYSDIWVDNMRMIHAICKEYDIANFIFLQPMREVGGYIKGGELINPKIQDKVVFSMECNEWYEDVRNKIEQLDYIIDFSYIFEGFSNMYMDECHVFESGNKIIADEILKRIIKTLRGKMKEKVQ